MRSNQHGPRPILPRKHKTSSSLTFSHRTIRRPALARAAARQPPLPCTPAPPNGISLPRPDRLPGPAQAQNIFKSDLFPSPPQTYRSTASRFYNNPGSGRGSRAEGALGHPALPAAGRSVPPGNPRTPEPVRHTATVRRRGAARGPPIDALPRTAPPQGGISRPRPARRRPSPAAPACSAAASRPPPAAAPRWPAAHRSAPASARTPRPRTPPTPPPARPRSSAPAAPATPAPPALLPPLPARHRHRHAPASRRQPGPSRRPLPRPPARLRKASSTCSMARRSPTGTS